MGSAPDYDLAVEFRHISWLEEAERDATFDLLEDEGLAFVCARERKPNGVDVLPMSIVDE